MFSRKYRSPSREIASVIQRVLLNVGAAAGSLCLIMTVLMLVFGLKPLIFASGSMGPDIPTGSLGVAVPASIEDISPGQIVSVINSGEQRVTHRVIEKTAGGLVLQGDANPMPDLETYHVDTADRLIFSVPLLGYVVSWLSKPWAFFAGGLLCAYLLYSVFRKREDRFGGERPSQDQDALASHSEGKNSEGRSTKVISGCLVLAMVAVLGVQSPNFEMTHAAFTGAAASTSKPTATVMQPVSNLQCSNKTSSQTNKVIDFSWQPPPAQNDKLAGYKISVIVNDSVQERAELLAPNVTTYAMDITRTDGLLGILLGLLENLLGARFDVNFSVTAVYASGWSSVVKTYTGAKGYIAPLDLSRTLRCS